jgi:hypothetical protein
MEQASQDHADLAGLRDEDAAFRWFDRGIVVYSAVATFGFWTRERNRLRDDRGFREVL